MKWQFGSPKTPHTGDYFLAEVDTPVAHERFAVVLFDQFDGHGKNNPGFYSVGSLRRIVYPILQHIEVEPPLKLYQFAYAQDGTVHREYMFSILNEPARLRKQCNVFDPGDVDPELFEKTFQLGIITQITSLDQVPETDLTFMPYCDDYMRTDIQDEIWHFFEQRNG